MDAPSSPNEAWLLSHGIMVSWYNREKQSPSPHPNHQTLPIPYQAFPIMHPLSHEAFLIELRNEIAEILAETFPAAISDTPDLTQTFFRHELKLTVSAGETGRGDIATAIAMKLAGKLKKAPHVIGAEIIEALLARQSALTQQVPASTTATATAKPNTKSHIAAMTKAELIKPGFINLTFAPELKKRLIEGYAKTPIVAKPQVPVQKILMEYISANPTGPLHIGHGRWAVYGSILAKILRFAGREVYEEFYVNDAGNQIANLHASVKALREGKPIPTDGYHGEYLKDIAEEVKDTGNDPVEIMLREQQKTLRELRVTFNESHEDPEQVRKSLGKHFFRESTLHDDKKIQAMLTRLAQTELSYEKDGALWFASSEQGDDDKDRVIVKSDGSYTYFFNDILYHFSKLQRGYTHLIDILGGDHHGYKERITAATTQLYENVIKPEIAEGTSSLPFKMDVIIGQLANIIRDGKPIRMSKRTGEIITVEEVQAEIGADAMRYYLSQQSIDSTIEFDLEKAKSKNMDNPVYYIQYAHARIASIFKKAASVGILASVSRDPDGVHVLHTEIDQGNQRDKAPLSLHYSKIASPTVEKIWGQMIAFRGELDLIAESYEIHHLPRFLHAFAATFHKLYNETRFMPPEDSKAGKFEGDIERVQSYLILLSAIDRVIITGLDLMGIAHPDDM